MRIAEDGEIMIRGELVMHGYWRNLEESARVLRDGWLATGDIGHIDEKGRIEITDRKKDILVNDKGDNVSPQRVEGMLTRTRLRRRWSMATAGPPRGFARAGSGDRSSPDIHERLQRAVER